MSYKFEEGKDAIIEAVIKQARFSKEDPQHAVFIEFVQQFFETVALDDLKSISVENLYAAALNFLSFIHHRAPNETKIRIYNPDFERHGWQTTHTVVEIVCDDMPFLVDTVRMVLNRMHIASHLIITVGGLRVERNDQDEVISILGPHAHASEHMRLESPVLVEMDHQTDPTVLTELHQHLSRALDDNRAVYEDWMPMREKVRELIQELEHAPAMLDQDETAETRAFLHWIEDHHFTFLGIRDYELITKDNERILQGVPNTGLGVLRKKSEKVNARNISAMSAEAQELILSSQILLMSKTNTEATIHRNAYTDYIGVKRFDDKGNVIGERRIIGLYTSAAYNTNPKHIPFLRHKVARIIKNSKLNPQGHAGRVLLNIIDTLPRDDLIQASEDELLEMAMGIFHMQDRRRIRLFARMDVYHRFVSCLVYVPREIFNSELRREMQEVLRKELHGLSVTFSTWFSESILARIHFIVRINPEDDFEFDYKAIEQKLIEVARSWVDDFHDLLLEEFGEERANQLFTKYKKAFQPGYTTNFSPKTALFDLKHLESVSTTDSLGMNFYRPIDEQPDQYRFKIYRNDSTIPLSDVLPILENLGLRAITERPFVLRFPDDSESWINEFSLQYTGAIAFELDDIRDYFQEAFTRIWFGDADNDGFNRLVLSAGLDWRQVVMLRMYAKYFKQIGFTFSQEYIEDALNHNTLIAQKLVRLFELRFNPNSIADRQQQYDAMVAEIHGDLDEVSNLDEDKIIRQFMHAIAATTRTNYYQDMGDGVFKPYVSIKLNSKSIPGMPRPCPMFEIFVYSPTFEGVHLRGGKVARGGLRWSDRREDFRTEILGLMKAQQVKNAVIVPSGAKGGFVPKQLPLDGTREAIQSEGIRCYQQFIRGLLDITDDYFDNSICKPRSVVCYDEDDPYLVVAADKGTATFSDIANAISLEYGFWLGDAFASGGSVGYDHKKMGITAKGAWESVKRHFYELGVNINTTDFTVVGIGDLAGDVFGNGMLLSNHIQLVAAFNHMHIFIDPTPCAETSFKERQRIFNLPRSTWDDYDASLISKGGGVFRRNAKSIAVTPEMKARFDIEADVVEPNELIRYVLKARVDLLWSGGIGTFVKAEHQPNSDVGDRTNDLIRINGNELRCKVVGEGGNLGFTQSGRVEYSLNGGRIYTDFIDNSAGVSCSDKEVNIKILLNRIVESGDLTEKQRNVLLSDMSDDVSDLVLRENYMQPRSISLTEYQSSRLLELQARYISELERLGKIDRELEFLPSEKELNERKLMGIGLTAPCISLMLCYSKITLKEAILASNLPEEPFLNPLLVSSFPTALQQRYHAQMQTHPLRREIIATRLSNIIVNEMGFSFVYRLQGELAVTGPAVVRAYMIARNVLNMERIWSQIEALDSHVSADYQQGIAVIYLRLLRRVTRCFLRQNRTQMDMADAVTLYGKGIDALKKAIPEAYSEAVRSKYKAHMVAYRKVSIPESLAHDLSIAAELFPSVDLIEISTQLNLPIIDVAKVYYAVGDRLDLNWIRLQVIEHTTENHWEAMSREALRDDLDGLQRLLTVGVLRTLEEGQNVASCVQAWAKQHSELVDRWHAVVANLRSSAVLNYTMFFVVIRELLDLTQTTTQEVIVN